MKRIFQIAAVMVAAFFARADSNFATDGSLSWSANTGWMDWSGDGKNGVEVDQFVCSGFIFSPNIGWISMGGGSPVNGIAYRNDSAIDFGVNVDAQGNMRGLAYGANIGWINFESAGNARVDLTTGKLTGFAYGANIGWISLADTIFGLRVDGMGDGKDSDGDRIPDAWELTHAKNLTSLTAAGDFDADGCLDVQEYLADTNPVDRTSSFRIEKLAFTPDRAVVELTWATRPSRQYFVQTRSALSPVDPWIDAGAGMLVPNGSSLTVQVRVGASVEQRYFRVQAVRPLAY